ncbi:MAG TPA: phosphatase PAP2 family protein [Bacilli bacterium]|nr:phosphatase PAP2 family protein [Bacilli bacterium]
MDRYLLLQIRKLVGRAHLLDRLMLHIAKYGPQWFFLGLGLAILLRGGLGLQAALTAVVAATATRGANEVIGRVYRRDRPFVREAYEPLLWHRPSFSFPSNHAACGFALAVAVFLFLPAYGVALLVLASLLAFSRVYVGVHYPADVTFGAGIGSGVAWVIAWFASMIY